MRDSSLNVAVWLHELQESNSLPIYILRAMCPPSMRISSLKVAVWLQVARMQPIHQDRSKTYEGYMPSFSFINENFLTRCCWVCRQEAYDSAENGCKNPGCATTLGYLALLRDGCPHSIMQFNHLHRNSGCPHPISHDYIQPLALKVRVSLIE